ncbi:MAG TPA: long-chain fatty acid--CoA ligase [Rhodobacteraceae bacterium]|nr:long-chain fatty acid--CoA ligase [Paracoccaceae bacterium]HBV56037.1 long-chain fatty acid--CoA ligase [Paracoccaceae bacterium]
MSAPLHHKHWPPGVPHHLEMVPQTLTEAVAQTVARVPDHPAMIYHGRVTTYATLWARIEALAGWLQNQGVTKGDRVLLLAQNSPQFVEGYHAILRADAVVVPVNPMSREAELTHLAQDTGANVMLAGQELLPFALPLLDAGLLTTLLVATYAEAVDPADPDPLPAGLDTLRAADLTDPRLTPWETAIHAGCAPRPAQAQPNDLAVLPYSSGTTGAPKGCMHSHYTTMAVLIGGLQWQAVDEADVHLATLPMFHVTGMQVGMNGSLISGGTIVIMTRWDRRRAADLIRRHGVTRWRSIATMAIDMVNDPDVASYDFSSLKAIGGGGAAMPEAIAAKLHLYTGLDYIEGYGLSETIAGTHVNPVHRPKRQCLGIPVQGVDSRIVNPDTLAELPQGDIGEIVTAAPQLFLGYWNRPEATAEVFFERDGRQFFRTGDLGYVDEDGYFFMVDRLKRMINASGYKVWPAEVEALMFRHPDIAEACVISTADARRGESVRAYVVPTPSAKGHLTEAAIIAWCQTQMSAYKCPRSIVFTDALPKSGAGKVLWRMLQEQDSATAATKKGAQA